MKFRKVFYVFSVLMNLPWTAAGYWGSRNAGMVVPRPIPQFNPKDYSSLKGMFVVETRDLSPLRPQRGVVLWMNNPGKYEKNEKFGSCMESIMGSHYFGPTFVSLVNSATHEVLQTVFLKSGDPDITGLTVPFRFKKGVLYSVHGNPNELGEYPTVLLDPVPLDGERGVEDYALFRAEDGCFCPEVIVYGYDSNTDSLFRTRVVDYSLDEKNKVVRNEMDSLFDLFFEVADHPGLKTYDFTSSVGHGSDITTCQRFKYDPATKGYYGVSADLTDKQSQGFEDPQKSQKFMEQLWEKCHPEPGAAQSLSVPTLPTPETADWQEWTEPDGRFSVLFPQKMGLYTTSPWTSQTSGNFYSISYGFLKPEEGADPPACMERALQKEPHGTGWKVLEKKFYKFQEFPAGEYRTEDDGGLKVTRFVLIYQRLYKMSVEAMKKDFDTPSMDKFFGSFRLIHPEIGAGKWLEFSSGPGRFSILMPNIPKDSPGDHDWRVGDDTNWFFEVEFNDDKDLSDQTFEKDVLGVAEKLPGTLVEKKIFKYQGFPAAQFIVETSDGMELVSRFVLVHFRLYDMPCMGPKKNYNPEKVGKFFDSLKINHPELNITPAGKK